MPDFFCIFAAKFKNNQKTHEKMNKKTTILLTAALFSTLTALCQEVLTFRVSYEKEDTRRGELYQYSERYLGVSDVVREDGTCYRLTDIRMPEPAADGNKQQQETGKKSSTINFVQDKAVILPVPLNEETLTATNTAKKAEGVAKQIYRLREARVNIVSGEAEHAPADGMAMKTSLRELKEMERQPPNSKYTSAMSLRRALNLKAKWC